MQESKSREEAMGHEMRPLRLYLGGIPLHCQESDLRKHFGQYGEVLCSGINKNKEGHPRGCGYVVLGSRNLDCDAKRIIELDHAILGKKIEVKRYVECEKERQRILQEDNEKAVHVCGLPLEATESDISNYFCKFGKIDRAYIICKDGKSRGFGFIRFLCPGSADKVLAREHFILDKKIGVSRKLTRNAKKIEGSKSGGTRSITQTSSGAGSNEVGANLNIPGHFGHQNQIPGQQQPISYSQSQCIMVNGVAYAPVPMNYSPICMPMGQYAPQYLPMPPCYGGYYPPQMTGYPMQGYMFPMAGNPGMPHQYQGPSQAEYSKHKSAGSYQAPADQYKRCDIDMQNHWKANSASYKRKSATGSTLPEQDAFSTASINPCYSTQEAQGTHEIGKDQKGNTSFFDKIKKQYCPFGKVPGFSTCEKVLSAFADNKQCAQDKTRSTAVSQPAQNQTACGKPSLEKSWERRVPRPDGSD